MRILVTEEDVTPDVEEAVVSTLGWFEGQPIRTHEFIDRLCNSESDGSWDIESYDNPAARKVMRIARQARRDAA